MSASEWAIASVASHYHGSADDRRDGFIHLSTVAQLAGTLARHFAGRDDLMLIAVATQMLGDELRWEPSRGGELFPHLYADLPTAAAVQSWPLAKAPDGTARLPDLSAFGQS